MSLDSFIDEVIWNGSGDYRQFFEADWSYTTDRLAKFYGDAWKPADAEGPAMRRSVADGNQRFGLITHPYLMSALAHFDTSSPIHRGVFLIRYTLGRTLRPPAEAIAPISPDLHPNLTTRQRVAEQTKAEGCQVCHGKINSLGFALENFDAVGRFRDMEREQPVDAAGSYTARSGENVNFNGARELARYLAGSPDAHRAFVNRAFQYFVKQPIAAYGPTKLDELTAKFAASGYNVRDLLVEIAVIAATEDPALNEQDS